MNWLDQARCKGIGPDPFFQQVREGGDLKYKLARSMCLSCPVKAQCLEATINEEWTESFLYGMRAGLLPRERRKLIRQKKAEIRQTKLNEGRAAS